MLFEVFAAVMGLVAVLAHLDCTFAWDETGSKTEYAERKASVTEVLAS